MGPAYTLPADPPQNECERGRWLELVETEYRPAPPPTPPPVYGGLGVFRLNAADPEALEQLFPRMDEPDLRWEHEERIKPADTAYRRAMAALLIGSGGLFVGVGTAAALNDSHHDAANVFGVSGLAIGLVGVVLGLILTPSENARMAAEARHYLFVEGEDDNGAVERGVNRANQATRQDCQGR